MVRAEEQVVDIMQKCGFLDNFLETMDINDRIRELEDLARRRRPSTSSRTEPLTRFLPEDLSRKLEDLRNKKRKLKDQEDNIMHCVDNKIKKENIKIIRTPMGIFAEKMNTDISVLFE